MEINNTNKIMQNYKTVGIIKNYTLISKLKKTDKTIY